MGEVFDHERQRGNFVPVGRSKFFVWSACECGGCSPGLGGRGFLSIAGHFPGLQGGRLCGPFFSGSVGRLECRFAWLHFLGDFALRIDCAQIIFQLVSQTRTFSARLKRRVQPCAVLGGRGFLSIAGHFPGIPAQAWVSVRHDGVPTPDVARPAQG